MISTLLQPLPDPLPCHTMTILMPTITYHLLLRVPALLSNTYLPRATLVQTSRDFDRCALQIEVLTGAMGGHKEGAEGDVGVVMHQDEEGGTLGAAILDPGLTTLRPTCHHPRLPQLHHGQHNHITILLFLLNLVILPHRHRISQRHGVFSLLITQMPRTFSHTFSRTSTRDSLPCSVSTRILRRRHSTCHLGKDPGKVR